MNSKLTLGATGALLALIASASSASAAVLVDYKMTAAGQPLTHTVTGAPTFVAANVIAPSLTNQLGAGPAGSNNFNGGTDRTSIWATATGTANSTYAAAFTAGNYVTFSLTAATGYTISLDSISFQAAAATSTSTAKRSFFLVSETGATNFTSASTVLVGDMTASATPLGGTLPVQTADPIYTVPKDYSVSLASLGVINEGETRVFRFYIQTEGGSQSLAFDDIVVNGTVSPVSAIPEPSAFAALAGLAGLGLAASRRRRR